MTPKFSNILDLNGPIVDEKFEVILTPKFSNILDLIGPIVDEKFR